MIKESWVVSSFSGRRREEKKKKKSVRRKRVMVLRERTFKFGLEEHFDSVLRISIIYWFNFMVVPYLVNVLSNQILDIIAQEDDYDNVFLVLYTEDFL